MSPCSFIPGSKRHILIYKTPCRQQTKFCQRASYLWRAPKSTFQDQEIFSFPLPQSFIITEWLLLGCSPIIHQTGVNSVTQFAEVIQMEIALNMTFFPNIFSQIVKLGTTNTSNFHPSSNVVSLCFLPVQVLPLSLLPHGSICDHVQKENVFMPNAHACISKRLAEQAG